MNTEDDGESKVADAISTAVDVVTHAITGVSIPAPLRKNAFKAFAQLCTAAVDIPVAHLEGVAAEKRAETQARLKLIAAVGNQIADQIAVPREYAETAVRKFAGRVVREQVNLDAVSEAAARELANPTKSISTKSEAEAEPALIDDDWLNSFQREASQKSSEEMHQLFGRILAEEIRTPSTFSLKTVRLLGQLDSSTAQLFRTFCSLSVSMTLGRQIFDARVVSLSGAASANSLQPYGLGFGELNKLHEYGLIIADYNSYMDYQHSVVQNHHVALPLMYEDQQWGLRPREGYSKGNEVRLNGVALSRSGTELLRIVDPVPDAKYTKALEEYFEKLQLRMVRIEGTILSGPTSGDEQTG